MGLKRICVEAIEHIQAKLDEIDFVSAAAWEKRLLHYVMAHVHTFEEAAPAAKGIIHLGATSQYVVDNADLIIMRDALKLVEEPFEEEQVGSSAMAYKRNPMRCERATGLARFVISLASSPLQTAAEQWFERTLDDSSNKRLTIPEPFLAIDGALILVINVARGLVVYPNTINAAVMAELPFMATEEILMAAVRAGGDRQQLHELIRRHSQAAAEQVKSHGRPNDLTHRLQQDPAFGKLNINHLLDPAQFIGRSPQQ